MSAVKAFYIQFIFLSHVSLRKGKIQQKFHLRKLNNIGAWKKCKDLINLWRMYYKFAILHVYLRFGICRNECLFSIGVALVTFKNLFHAESKANEDHFRHDSRVRLANKHLNRWITLIQLYIYHVRTSLFFVNLQKSYLNPHWDNKDL